MVSLDSPEKNKQFADSVGAHFVLLTDLDKSSAKALGVLGVGGLWTKRWTFYIDGEGDVVKIDKDVDPQNHGQDVVKALGELGFPKRK